MSRRNIVSLTLATFVSLLIVAFVVINSAPRHKIVFGQLIDQYGVGVASKEVFARRWRHSKDTESESDKTFRSTTDELGNFKFQLPAGWDRVELFVEEPKNLINTVYDLEDRWSENEVLSIVAPQPHNVEVTVVGSQGELVVGAEVVARELASANAIADVKPKNKEIRAISNALGVATLTGLSNDPYVLDARFGAVRSGESVLEPQKQKTLNLTSTVVLPEFQFIRGVVVSYEGSQIGDALLKGRAAGSEVSVTADHDGAFSLGPFARGSNVNIIATARGFAESRSNNYIPPMADVRVRLRKSVGLIGSVIDESTGRPVTTFKVSFSRKKVVPSRSSSYPGSREFFSEDGTFFFGDIEPGNWDINVQADGYVTSTLEKVAIRNDDTNLDVRLVPGKPIVGRVIDSATRSPVKGASITVLNRVLGAYDSLLSTDRQSTRSDTDGSFSLLGLPDSEVTLLVRAPGYSQLEKVINISTTDSFPVEFLLSRGGEISGTLIGHSENRSFGHIRLQNIVFGTSATIPTTPDGEYRFDHLMLGTYFLSAESEFGRSEVHRIDVTEEDLSIKQDLVLIEGGTISGLVEGQSPGEAGGCRIVARQSNSLVAQTMCNSENEFKLIGLPPGRIELTAKTTTEREIVKDVQVKAGLATFVEFTFSGSARLRGKITRLQKPVPFVVVEARSVSGAGLTAIGESTRSGEYLMDGLPAGDYIVSAVGRSVQMRVSVSGDTYLDFELKSAHLEGVALDRDAGLPVSGVKVTLDSEFSVDSRPLQRVTETNSDGEFMIRDLLDGEYVLTAYKLGFNLVESHVYVSEEQNSIQLAFEPVESRKISVVSSGTGTPLRRVFVVASSDSSRTTVDLPLNAEGVGLLSTGLVGMDLELSWLGFEPSTIDNWQGEDLSIRLALKDLE